MPVDQTLKDYILGLQHIGHIVPDVDAAIDAFQTLYGTSQTSIRRVPEIADAAAPVLFAFVRVADTEFEIIQPQSEAARAQLFASPGGGGGINHIAWRVSDLDACLALLREQGVRPGHVTPDGLVEFGDRRMVYLNPEDCDGMLVELIEILD